MIAAISIAIAINAVFLIFMVFAIRLGWVTPAVTQQLLNEFSAVIQASIQDMLANPKVVQEALEKHMATMPPKTTEALVAHLGASNTPTGPLPPVQRHIGA